MLTSLDRKIKHHI